MEGRFSVERDNLRWGGSGMSERTERSEGHERMPRGGGGMSERTERSEGHERMPRGGTA
jgi:hypothetical protein